MADINISDVTNVGGTGTFDVLMAAVGTQVELQYAANRITGSDYANVYLGSIQAALTQSIQFNLQEQLVEAQVAGVLADNLLKAKQLLQVVKQTDVTEREMVEKESTGTKQRILLDEEKATSDAQQLILAKDLLLKAEQIKTTYTDRVVKDKQASKLGLDNAMKQSEAARQSDPTLIYTPKYTEV